MRVLGHISLIFTPFLQIVYIVFPFNNWYNYYIANIFIREFFNKG